MTRNSAATPRRSFRAPRPVPTLRDIVRLSAVSASIVLVPLVATAVGMLFFGVQSTAMAVAPFGVPYIAFLMLASFDLEDNIRPAIRAYRAVQVA